MESSTRSQVLMAHLFCISQQFTSVLVYVLGKKIFAVVNVHLFVFIRLLFVIPVTIIAAMLFTRKLEAFRVHRKILLIIFVSALISILVSQSLMFTGLDRSTPTNASIISAPCTPLFAAVFSVLRGTDKITIPKGLGFLSSVAGALLLLQVWNFEFKGTTLGNLLIVGSSLCSATNLQIQKYILNTGLHPLVLQSYVCSMGVIAWICGYSGFGLFDSVDWVIPAKMWLYISIVGVIATAIPWCVGIVALKHMSPMTTSVYTILQPLIAVFVGVFITGETLTWIQFIGGGLVLLGLVLVQATPLVKQFYENYKKKGKFQLLSTEDESEVELSVVGDKDEIEYKLAQKGETNDFVIADGADYIPAFPKDAMDTGDCKPAAVAKEKPEKLHDGREGKRTMDITVCTSPTMRSVV